MYRKLIWTLVAMLAAIGVAAIGAPSAQACNIPVFRYALERWKQDKCKIVVFHDGQLSRADQLDVDFWLASIQGGANVEVVQADVKSFEDKAPADATPENNELVELWDSTRESVNGKLQLPYVVVRTTVGRGKTISHSAGPLKKVARQNVMLSPARKELRTRLLAGHSVVWVMLKSGDEEKNKAVRGRLEKQFKTLAKNVELPDGIGLPGSELYAEVPLFIKFSILEIDPKDPNETFLIDLLSSFKPSAFKNGEPLLAPVFGRGRVLEVLAADECKEAMVEDLTVFLSGPCSCQVKSLNPGFDMLLPANWQFDLFGDDGKTPPDRTDAEGKNRPPVLLQIPPGRKKK